MKKRWLVVLLVFVFSSITSLSASEDETTSYDDINFPQWSKDLRRTEIITLGSFPFVTLWTTLGYSLAVLGEFHNPLDKSTSSFSTDDQKRIIAYSAGICVGLGLTDLAITLIKRSYNKRKIREQRQVITISSFSEREKEKNICPRLNLARKKSINEILKKLVLMILKNTFLGR
ncbi:hypothetical protein [Treponema zioleckii]|uniref:hypothetical protein n=1 Tax=Treponema zioleckii TaxID=331680 RepID=UPI00168BEDD1|nr:hypothetical protein [Treponema zioleckii]